MKKIYIIFFLFTLLCFFNIEALSSQRNFYTCPPETVIPSTGTSRLNIVIFNSYKGASVYMSGIVVSSKKTSNKGNFEYTLPALRNGCHILKIQNRYASKNFTFYLKEPSWLICHGQKNFCCILTRNKIELNKIECKP